MLSPAQKTERASWRLPIGACPGEFAICRGGCCWWRSWPSTASRKADAYSNQGSLLGTHLANTPSDSTFRLLLSQLDVDGFEALLQPWMAVEPGVAETVDTLVGDGTALRRRLDRLELEGSLVQADALHANAAVTSPGRCRACPIPRGSSRVEILANCAAWADLATAGGPGWRPCRLR